LCNSVVCFVIWRNKYEIKSLADASVQSHTFIVLFYVNGLLLTRTGYHFTEVF
jgi:hypothetical protein